MLYVSSDRWRLVGPPLSQLEWKLLPSNTEAYKKQRQATIAAKQFAVGNLNWSLNDPKQESPFQVVEQELTSDVFVVSWRDKIRGGTSRGLGLKAQAQF